MKSIVIIINVLSVLIAVGALGLAIRVAYMQVLSERPYLGIEGIQPKIEAESNLYSLLMRFKNIGKHAATNLRGGTVVLCEAREGFKSEITKGSIRILEIVTPISSQQRLNYNLSFTTSEKFQKIYILMHLEYSSDIFLLRKKNFEQTYYFSIPIEPDGSILSKHLSDLTLCNVEEKARIDHILNELQVDWKEYLYERRE